MQVGAILANMVTSYLDAAPPPISEEMHDDYDAFKDQPAAPDAESLRLHPSVDLDAGSVQSGEHRAPIQSDQQGQGLRVEPGSDPGSGRRPGQSGSSAGQRTDFK